MTQPSKMKVLLYESHCDWLHQLVLWDGENTYWHDGMKPSSGYKSMRKMKYWSRKMGTQWTLIGEL